MKTFQARYTVIFIVLIAAIALMTEQGIEHFVAPKIQATEEQVVLQEVDQVATRILTDLARVKAQSRGITQAVPLLESDGVDRVMPGLIDQYGTPRCLAAGSGRWRKCVRRAVTSTAPFIIGMFQGSWWSAPTGTLMRRPTTTSNRGTKLAKMLPKGNAPGRRLIRMRPARNRAPTVQWVFIRTARCSACRPSTLP